MMGMDDMFDWERGGREMGEDKKMHHHYLFQSILASSTYFRKNRPRRRSRDPCKQIHERSWLFFEFSCTFPGL